MQNNKLIKRTIPTSMIILILLAAIFLAIPKTETVDAAYAAGVQEIYYADDSYSDNGEPTVQTETFNYSTQQITAIKLLNNSSFPAYYNLNDSLTNTCANVAGANIIGYYDRYYENLIPDYVPGITRGSNYIYYPMTNNVAKKQDVINDLYVRMNTNVNNVGTTQTEYKNGLTSYINSKGRSVSYSSVMSNSYLDIIKLDQSFNNGQPVSLYLSGYNITQINDNNGSTTLNKSIYTDNHIMIIYGFKIINYYSSSNTLIKSITYLYVATGKTNTGYYILDNNGTINDAEAVSIS